MARDGFAWAFTRTASTDCVGEQEVARAALACSRMIANRRGIGGHSNERNLDSSLLGALEPP